MSKEILRERTVPRTRSTTRLAKPGQHVVTERTEAAKMKAVWGACPGSRKSCERACLGPQAPAARFLLQTLILSSFVACKPAASSTALTAFSVNMLPDAASNLLAGESHSRGWAGHGVSNLGRWARGRCKHSSPQPMARMLPHSAPGISFYRCKGPTMPIKATAAEGAADLMYCETERFLLEYVGIDCDQLTELMDATPFPSLRTKSLERDIRPSVRFLIDEAGLPQKNVGKALLTCPQLLGVGVPSLRSGLEFLCEVGIPRERIPRVVERFPHILKYSVECNLRPSAEFLRRELCLSEAQLAEIVEKQPACLQVKS